MQLIPDSLACRLYIATVLLETTIDLAIEGELYLRAKNNRNSADNSEDSQASPMSVYLSLFAFAQYAAKSFRAKSQQPNFM